MYSEQKEALAQEIELKRPAVLAVSGVHNSGKTTLLEKLLPVLRSRGLKVGIIKHDGHDFTPDVPGTPDVTPDAPAQTTPAQSTPAQDTPADAAVTPDATTAQTTATASGEQQITANAALPKTGANWLAVVGSAISGIFLLAAGFVLDRRSRRQN